MLQVVVADDNDSVAHTVLRYARSSMLVSPLLVDLTRQSSLAVFSSVYYRDEPEAVVAGYEAIIAAAPHHVRAVHSLATLRGDATSAAPAYVQQVFDELAETFEDKLVTHLEYRVPWLLVDALTRMEYSVFANGETGATGTASSTDGLTPKTWRVADVGCGTGLCGRLLRPFVAHLIGVRSALSFALTLYPLASHQFVVSL